VNLDSADITMLLVLIGTVLVVDLLAFRSAREHRMKSQRYQLFAIRDRFVRLVIDGKLTEDNLVYRSFCSAINLLVQAPDKITVETLIEARKQGVDPAQQELQSKLLESLKHESEDVQEIARDFYRVIFKILIANTPILGFIFGCIPFIAGMANLVEFLARPFSSAAKSVFRDYEQLARRDNYAAALST